MGTNVQVDSGLVSSDILVYLHFVYPVILLIVFLAAFMLHSVLASPYYPVPRTSHLIRGPGGKLLPQQQYCEHSKRWNSRTHLLSPAKRMAFTWLTAGIAVTLVADAALIALHALVERENHWWCGQNSVVYVVGSFVVYIFIVLSLIDSKPSPNWAHAITWGVSLGMELPLLVSSMSLFTARLSDDLYTNPTEYDGRQRPTKWESVETAIKLVRVFFLALLLSLWWLFTRNINIIYKAQGDNESRIGEDTRLLNGHVGTHANSKNYGSLPENEPQVQSEENQPKDGWARPDKMPERGWYEYIRSYSLFFPYLWPSRSRRLQVTVLLCLFLVALARVANVLVPKQSGRIVNQLAGEDGQVGYIPWTSIAVYVILRIFQGSNGLLGALRSVLWIPVSQYSYRELATAAFEHVHGLSLDFHLNKKTGEVVSALNKGGSINGFLETVTFNLLPMLIDMVVAVFYFSSAYDAYYALTLFVMIILYMFVTIRMTQTRVHQRRAMANLDREEQAVKNDSLMSYETVKYFNAEEREFNRYRDAVKAYQKAEYKVYFSLQALNVSQMGIFMAGLLITCLIAAYQVARGRREVGSFVELITYMSQLQAPLNYFGTFYRSIQSSMINAERLLELFKQQPSVVDEFDAKELTECRGEIRCNDVEFAYNSRHPALKGVTFRCAPGTSTALVGESGGGKSTIFRLLFRFYNLNGGSIERYGRDVRGVTMDSIRRHIGVVPQDTILFNETIMYNLRYANPEATDEQVFEACRAACIHDKILAFPDGYDSKVGERGLKLSGGEKQRIAIARTILKNPRIILLDEATAALDTDTEDQIQEALNNLQSDRTTLIIAHRLSTITKCDQILVLNGGKIVEAGTHAELVEKGGRYASLWKKQMKANKFNLEISRLTNKARRLQENAGGDDSPSASQSEDERGSLSPSESRKTQESSPQSSIRGHKRQENNPANNTNGVNEEDTTQI